MRTKMPGAAGCIIIVLLWMGNGAAGVAQPTLQISRLVNNWPTIELYYTVSCGGVRQTINDPARFSVREQGFPVTFDTQNCPDTNVRCPLSIALAFDASETMAGARNLAAKAAGHRFIDSLDGSTDEALVIWFNDSVAVAQSLTSDSSLLHNAVRGIPASGGTRFEDAGIVAAMELAAGASNACTALVIVTDGGGNTGTIWQNVFFPIVREKRIRVYSIGIGSGVQMAILDNISILTGGKSYLVLDPGELPAVYSSIAHICLQSFQECSLSYTAGCTDGSIRTVDLAVSGICGGSDTKVKSYKAPKDTSTFTTLHFGIGRADVEGDGTFSVPLLLEDTVDGVRAGVFTWSLLVPDSLALCLGADVPPGSPFAGQSITMQTMWSGKAGNTRYDFSTNDTILLQSSRPSTPVALLHFRATDRRGNDTACGTFDLIDGGFSSGCLRAAFTDADLCVRARAPFVVCDGDTLPHVAWDTNTDAYTLTPPLFTTRVRNVGVIPAETYRVTIQFDSRDLVLTGTLPLTQAGWPDTLFPNETGTAWWEGVLSPRLAGDSVPISFRQEFTNHAPFLCGGKMWVPASEPRVRAIGSPRMCEGGSVMLTATPGFVHYEWSDGQSGDTIVVRIGGAYYCTVTDTYGRMKDTPKFSVEVAPRPRPYLDPAGPLVLCDSTPVLLRVMQPFQSYRWSTGENTQSILATRPGRYWAEVTDGAGCTGITDTLVITIRRGPAAIVTGPAQACAGSVSTCRANGIPGARYRWFVEGADILLGHDTDALTVRWGRDSVARIVLALTDSAAQCTAFDTLQVRILSAPVARITPAGPTDVCAGDSVVLDAGAGYTSYLWSTGHRGRLLTAKTSAAYHAIVTDARGCSVSTDTVHVIVRRALRPRIAGTQSVCAGAMEQYSVAAASGQSVQWTVTGGVVLGAADQPLVTVQWSGRGAGGVRAELTDGPCSAHDSVLVRITAAATPAITTSGATSFCEGDSVSLDAGSGYAAYAWSDGSTTRSIVVHRGGVYTVAVVDSSGCSAHSDTVVVTVFTRPPAPMITRNGNMLATQPGYTHYRWMHDGVTIQGATRDTLTVFVSGTYSVEIVDSNGCSAVSTQYPVIVTNVETAASTRPVVHVYPEPNRGSFVVQIQAASRLERIYIYDILGRIVYETEWLLPVTAAHIDLHDLPDGHYLLRVSGVTKRVTIVR
ncbi:MAG: VWA domain-containing protein [Ignavibacteriae bacterium]|nr:VWA domain-containing protein [Ignavibacteriota bacterium]